MYLREVTFCLLVCVFGVVIQGHPGEERDDLDIGYYWREYTRDIPKDALPGGMDRRGKTTYIGQTLHTECGSEVVVTGQIREAEQKMTYEWGYRENLADKRVQVLCSRHPDHFKWIKTNPTDIKTLNHLHLISGGVEKNYSVYIGRIFRDGEIAIGKVLDTNLSGFFGLYTTMNGTKIHEKFVFEVLSYDPNVPKKQEKPQASKLKSPNSASANCVWQPIFVIVCLQTFYFSLKL